MKGIIRGLGVNRLLGLAVLAVALGALTGPEGVSAQDGTVAPNQPGFGTIVVQKELVGPGGGAIMGDRAGFVFSVQPAGGAPFTLGMTDAMGQITVGVAPGNYTISEQPRPGARLVEFRIGGVRVESFQVTAGQTLTITAINEIQGNGRITITKQIVDANGNPIQQGVNVQGFQFTVTGPNNFTANLTSGADGRASIANLAPGNYAVSETPPAGAILHAMAVDGVPVTNGQAFPVTNGQDRQVLVQNRMGMTPGPTQPIRLLTGCNNEALTWSAGTALTTVAAAVTPAGTLMSIFKLDTATGRFRGFSPTAPSFANDYSMVESSLEAVFLCVSAAATLNRPAP